MVGAIQMLLLTISCHPSSTSSNPIIGCPSSAQVSNTGYKIVSKTTVLVPLWSRDTSHAEEHKTESFHEMAELKTP